MNTNVTLYRILNPAEEPKGQVLSSARQSQFRREVFAYRRLSHDIYILAKKTGLTLMNAVRIAENVPAFLDELNGFFQSKAPEYDLQLMGVNDPIRYISGDELYDFSVNYINDVNETGLFYDWGNEYYLWEFIWEMVRNYEFPDKPSRMKSTFFFERIEDAKEFLGQYRDSEYKLTQVSFCDGETQSFDMNWFSSMPSNIPLFEVEKYARNYWEQKMTENPVLEVLFQGTYRWD